MLNPVSVPLWSTTTGGSTRVTTRSSEVLVWAVADAPIASSVTNTTAIRLNIPAIRAPSPINRPAARLLSEKACIGKGLHLKIGNDGALSPSPPRRQDAGNPPRQNCDKSPGSGEPGKATQQRPLRCRRQLPVCVNLRRSGPG